MCPNEISKNKRSGLYSASFTSLTDGDQKMIDFKVYLDCHNSIPLSHRFNEVRKIDFHEMSTESDYLSKMLKYINFS